MTIPCKQTTVPTVDNSAQECGDCGFQFLECIKTKEAIPYIGVGVNDTLFTIIFKLIKDLRKKGSRIKNLEDELILIKERLTALEP